jgi:uncharacterized membrane protein
MTDRLFLFIGALSSKTFAMLVSSSSFLLSAAVGEALTNQAGLAILAGAIGTGFAAVCLVVPRVMEQRRKSRESTAKVQSDATESAAKLQSDSIALLMNAHDRDVNFYKSEIAAAKLERAHLIDAKHKAAGEWFAAVNAFRILEGQLRGLGQSPEICLNPAKYLDIVGEADQSLKATAAARVSESPAGV